MEEYRAVEKDMYGKMFNWREGVIVHVIYIVMFIIVTYMLDVYCQHREDYNKILPTYITTEKDLFVNKVGWLDKMNWWEAA